jgi:AbiV family abortive infection protein
MAKHVIQPGSSSGPERLREYSRGGQLILENAEALYEEAQALREAGFLARAAFLHQISMEECAKVDMLGGWVTTVLMGGKISERAMARVFRDHKAKNYANACNAKPTPDEREAKRRGDSEAARVAFKRFQAMFHSEVNTTKNAALYVDFKDGESISPKDAIPLETVIVLAALNADFLSRTSLFVRLLGRMTNETSTFEGFVKHFVRRAEELRRAGKRDPETLMGELLREMREIYN